ncbi:hypothetical protein O3Q52_03880 [Streptomyces sp. ActVer]|uniref:hypothetical protein n=1 Tax=Streptomyces sp. ActVer TaxID=3014558 RepID=UPI0022B3306D|nr:hypothetical protein [Streptomyces sp. ActVer]MCZ4507359.1 hypothetical protein [Streptomyces sp. ActVer]
MKNGQVALALAGGYFLGRAHKMRWALALAGMAAGSRLRPGGGGAATKLLKSPEINKLTQTVRNELLSAGKTAAVAAAGSRIDSLSDRMQRRASSLRAGPEAEEPEDNEEEPRDEEEEEEEEEEPAEEEEEEPAEEAKQRERGRPARTRAPSSKGRTRTPATRPATDKKKTSASSSKSASKSAGRKTATGRRTASSGSSGSGGSARRDRG